MKNKSKEQVGSVQIDFLFGVLKLYDLFVF